MNGDLIYELKPIITKMIQVILIPANEQTVISSDYYQADHPLSQIWQSKSI
jgi:hypothetical protein